MEHAEHEEFLSCYLAHQELLRAYVAGVLRDWHQTDDLMQELGLVLWRLWERYDSSRPFGAWARGVATKLILKQRSRLARSRELLSPAALEALAAAYDEFDAITDRRLEALEHCLGHLDEPTRTMLRLRYGEDLELDGIASRLGRSVAAVGKALQRLRGALGACVERQLIAREVRRG